MAMETNRSSGASGASCGSSMSEASQNRSPAKVPKANQVSAQDPSRNCPRQSSSQLSS